MNFDFSDEQKQLKDSARKFLERESTPQQVRAVLEGDAGYDKALWKGLAEMGFTGAAIPEEHGVAGLGYLELCVIAEELGRALAPVPFSSSVYLFTEFLKVAGSDAQKATHLPKLAAGKQIGTFAYAEGVGEVTPARIKAS
ncbi:MAG: acyl-CoA dehydrogenase family protein, partial [Alphaproteobacteria bacterium]|nr:acyl-CoA dehydrogenase family protein [Alphaproteobacteria bacterium]